MGALDQHRLGIAFGNLAKLPEWPTLHEILTAVAHIVWEADNVEEAKELALPGQRAIIWSNINAIMT